jgi:hypothetical protein
MGEQSYLRVHLKISCKLLILKVLREISIFFMNYSGSLKLAIISKKVIILETFFRFI